MCTVVFTMHFIDLCEYSDEGGKHSRRVEAVSVRMLVRIVVIAGLPPHSTPGPSTCLSLLHHRLYSGSDTVSSQDGRWSCVVRAGGLADCTLCNINSYDCVLSVGRLGLTVSSFSLKSL